jgi:hypothetical protein
VDDWPVGAKSKVPGTTVIFGPDAVRACTNGPYTDCAEPPMLLIQEGYKAATGASGFGWWTLQPENCYCYDNIDLTSGSEGSWIRLFMHRGRLVGGEFGYALFLNDTYPYKINGSAPGFQTIVWATSVAQFTPGPGQCFELGAFVDFVLRAPMELVDNGSIWGGSQRVRVLPDRPEYGFVRTGNNGFPAATVLSPRLPAHRRRRFMPRVAIAGAR